MKQSRAASLIEAIINIAVGFGLSILFQATVLPLLGVQIPWSANFAFALVMTAVSIIRQFILRRVFEALHIRRPLSPAMRAIVAERFRQIETEGFDAAHDDDHDNGELAQAGATYALVETSYAANWKVKDLPPTWPWEAGWWKPRDKRRNLVRAGALILAEIEKFDRRRKPRPSL
jgi:hypothetical protein